MELRPSAPAARACLALCLLALSTLGACSNARALAPGSAIIDELDVIGAESIDEQRLREGLATRESPRFLLLQGVVYDYEFLDESLLERDLSRVERFYQARGYHEAKVTGARVIWLEKDRVRVEIAVVEGPPVYIGGESKPGMAVQLTGLESIEDTAVAAELIAASPQPGEIFDEDEYERAKSAMRRILADSGYAFAEVTGHVEVDLAHHEAQVRLAIEAGSRARFGTIEIAGLEGIPEDKVRESLLIAPGDDYSAAVLEDARRSLVNLGVFASVNVDADTSRPQSGRVPVTFTVRETAPRTLRLGGGARLDALQLSASLTGSWEHRNFLGGLRHLAIEARPGVVLFPTRMSNFPELEVPTRLMLQGSLDTRFTQPSFIEGRTKGLLSASLDVRPLLYADTQPNEPILGFLELGTRAGLERPFLSHQLFVTPALNWQAALPLDYRRLSSGELSPPVESRAFESLYILYPELMVRLDLRDDPLDPKRGLLLSNSLQLALPVLGGTVSDLRVRPEARFYVTKSHLTLAVRGTVGLLLPRNYGGESAEALSVADQQVLLFRGFFSGGPFSNRGYAFQGVGDHAPFRLSTDPGVRCGTAEPIDRAEPTDVINPRCLRPIGGLTLWEVSVELRFPLAFFEPLGAVLFLDASDVRTGRMEFGLDTPHLAPGLGLRYPTPVGPVRLDLGLRVLELLGTEAPEGSPPEIFGAPLTLHLAVGQAF